MAEAARTNKIKYGLCNVYVSRVTETNTNGVYSYTYATPVALPGAVNLSLEAQGERTAFRADNTDYYVTNSNNGYEGDLELAMIPDWFRTDILGEKTDTNGVSYEQASGAEAQMFALLFQFDGDFKNTRHCMYCCTATRPQVTSKTTEEGAIEPQTETISIKAIPRKNDKIVKSRCLETSAKYSGWFETVFVPTTA